MKAEEPIAWIANLRARTELAAASVAEILPPDLPTTIRRFHRQIPGYRMSPLKGLPNLAARLGLEGIWVKDESARLDPTLCGKEGFLFQSGIEPTPHDSSVPGRHPGLSQRAG